MKAMNLKLAAVVGAAFFAAGLANPATAGTNGANLTVSATVISSCSIATSAVAFGSYDPVVANLTTPINQTGTVQINCTAGATGVFVQLGQGLNFSGGRRMVSSTAAPTNYLNYVLYLPPDAIPGTACTYSGTQWGTTNGTDTLNPANGLWDGTVHTFNVCGVLTAGQTVKADTYSDTVVATVNF